MKLTDYIVPALVGAMLLLPMLFLALAKSKSKTGDSQPNHDLRLKHEAINRRHLRNGGGVLLEAIVAVVGIHAVILALWFIAVAFMSFQEPRW